MLSRLRELVHSAEIEGDELNSILLSFFGNASSDPFTRQIAYGNGEYTDLTLIFDNEGQLTKSLSGAGFTKDRQKALVQSVEENLIKDQSISVGNAILFCGAPSFGYFRFQDKIQLLPPPPSAPRVPLHNSSLKHPLMLEFELIGSNDALITHMRYGNNLRRWKWVLQCLLNTPVEMAELSDAVWINSENPRVASTLGTSGYRYPGDVKVQQFFSETHQLQPMKNETHEEYYKTTSDVMRRELTLPNSFDKNLSRYADLLQHSRRQFERACYWYQQAINAESSSASMIALAISIEALSPPTSKRMRCECCNSVLGATKMFKNVVQTLCPGSNSLRTKLYDIRSALAHGNLLLKNDISFTPLDQVSTLQLAQLRELQKIARTSLINWLDPNMRAEVAALAD